MDKKIKRAVIASLTVLPVAAVGGLAACGKKDSGKNETPPQTYTVTVGDPEGGDITADTESAVSGAQVTVTVAPDEGYELSYVTINGEQVPISEFEDDNAYTFEMPAENVTIECGFTAMKGAITVASGIKGGSVQADKTEAAAGETVTLTVKSDYGYELKSLKVNGEALTVKDGKATFTMPNTAASVTADFAFVTGAAVEAVPAVKAFSALGCKAAAGDTATSDYTVVFGDDAVTVTAYVQDKKVLAEKDGIALYFGVRGYKHTELDETNKYVKVTADGAAECGAVKDGDWASAESFATVGAAPWGKTDAAIDGYKITVKVPYTALGMADKAAALGNLTIMPMLLNSDNSFAAAEATLEGCDRNTPTTYPVFTADNKYTENEYKDGIGNLGAGNNVSVSGEWNLDQDYCKEDTEHYADRQAVLKNPRIDSDLVFYREKGKDIYAEATFKLDDLKNDERAGKFGLMLYDGGFQSGIFFYVDAHTDGKEGVLSNVKGTSLGYNIANGGWDFWYYLKHSDGSFDLETKEITLKMAYADNMIYFYCGDKLVGQMYYEAKGDVQMGIKSFNFEMTVSNYSVTADKTSDMFKTHIPVTKNEAVDVLFCGDSYMDFLDGYGVFDSTTQLIGQKANEGIGGTQAQHWSRGREHFIAMRYTPKQAVFHLGVNDIDNGKSVENTYNDLVAMFDKYHELLPDTKFYWVSLIPNKIWMQDKPLGSKNGEYKELNAKMKAYAQETEYLTYIDTETAFTNEDGGPRVNLLMGDGLHLNPVNGYPLWMKIINEALGYKVTDGSKFGYNEHAKVASTGGFEYDQVIDDAAQETLDAKIQNGWSSNIAEEAAWYKADYATDLKFETEINSPDHFVPDNYSKVGVALRNDDLTIFAYFETNNEQDPKKPTAKDGEATTYASIVYRTNNDAGMGVGDWNWADQAGGSFAVKNLKTGYGRIGIAKAGATIYLLVDGKVVASKKNIPGVTADTKFVPGVISFSRTVGVKNTQYTANTADFDDLVQINKMDGVLATDDGDVWTDAILANKSATYTVNNTLVDIFGVNTTKGVRLAVQIQHDRPVTEKAQIDKNDPNGWHTWLNLEVRLNHKDDVIIQANVKGHAVNCVAVNNTVTNPEGSARKYTTTFELFIDHGVCGTNVNDPVALRLGGVYERAFQWISYNGDWFNAITDQGITTDYTFAIYPDGKYSDAAWTDEVLNSTVSGYSNGALVTVKGVKTDKGILGGVTVLHNVDPLYQLRDPNAASYQWWHVLGPEMKIGKTGGEYKQVYINTYGACNNCVGSVISKENEKGSDYKYTSDFEFFVPYEILGATKADEIGLVFAGNYETGWDNSIIGNGDEWNNNSPTWFFTEHGMANKSAALSAAKLDGRLDDEVWKDQKVVTKVQGVRTEIMGFNGENGINIAVKATHPDPLKTQLTARGDWSSYLNYEFIIVDGAPSIQFGVNDGYHNNCDYAWHSVKNEDGTYTTTFEAFIPHGTYGSVTYAKGGEYAIAMGGVHNKTTFAWDIPWDKNLKIGSNGLSVDPNLTCNNYVLDCDFEKEIWKDAKDKVMTDTINGTDGKSANVKLIGRKVADGVLLGVTIDHDTAIGDVNTAGADAGFYGSYQYMEINLFAVPHPVPIFVAWNKFVQAANFDFAYKTVDHGANAEGKRYTTTYELFLPFSFWSDAVTDTSGDVLLTFILTAEGGKKNIGRTDYPAEDPNNVNFFYVDYSITDTGLVEVTGKHDYTPQG